MEALRIAGLHVEEKEQTPRRRRRRMQKQPSRYQAASQGCVFPVTSRRCVVKKDCKPTEDEPATKEA